MIKSFQVLRCLFLLFHYLNQLEKISFYRMKKLKFSIVPNHDFYPVFLQRKSQCLRKKLQNDHRNIKNNVLYSFEKKFKKLFQF